MLFMNKSKTTIFAVFYLVSIPLPLLIWLISYLILSSTLVKTVGIVASLIMTVSFYVSVGMIIPVGLTALASIIARNYILERNFYNPEQKWKQYTILSSIVITFIFGIIVTLVMRYVFHDQKFEPIILMTFPTAVILGCIFFSFMSCSFLSMKRQNKG